MRRPVHSPAAVLLKYSAAVLCSRRLQLSSFPFCPNAEQLRTAVHLFLFFLNKTPNTKLLHVLQRFQLTPVTSLLPNTLPSRHVPESLSSRSLILNPGETVKVPLLPPPLPSPYTCRPTTTQLIAISWHLGEAAIVTNYTQKVPFDILPRLLTSSRTFSRLSGLR